MIISSIYNKGQLNNIINYLDGAILMAPRFAINYGDINLDEEIELLKKHNKMIIIGMDKIFTESELKDAVGILNNYINDKDIYFYVSDLGLIYFAMENHIQNRFIYDPKTMITNYNDAKIYSSFNINALGLSSEITLEDIVKIKEENEFNYLYLVFGKRIMFYSKRKILDIYKRKLDIKNSDNPLYITEFDKNNRYPLIENQNGVAIYRDYFISLNKEISKIKDIKYLYLDSFDIDSNLYLDVIKGYFKYLNSEISNDELNNIIRNLDINIKDGFLYQDTIYQKEEIEDGKN